MIDPKYAHLPGIDASQPDVFETSDLPESDQPDPAASSSANDQQSVDAADQIETLKVDVKDVYEKFKVVSMFMRTLIKTLYYLL